MNFEVLNTEVRDDPQEASVTGEAGERRRYLCAQFTSAGQGPGPPPASGSLVSSRAQELHPALQSAVERDLGKIYLKYTENGDTTFEIWGTLGTLRGLDWTL